MKKVSKYIAEVISALMLIVSIPHSPVSAESYNIWDGSADSSWYSSSKSEFTISTAEQLAGLSELVSDGYDFRSKKITLACNIILNKNYGNYVEWGQAAPENTWSSIGSLQNKFNGTFDGAGYTIYGMYYKGTDGFGSLFGYVGEYGKIISTNTEASYLYSMSNSSGICSQLDRGTIENCTSDCIVICNYNYGGGICAKSNKGTITGCTNYGSVTALDSSVAYVGGICGYAANSTIELCKNYGNINSISGSYTGGIVGSGGNLIKKCINKGKITSESGQYVGGIAGKFSSELTECSNYADITSPNGQYIGGIGGYGGSLNGCANYGNVSGKYMVGGIVSAYPILWNCFNTGNVTAVSTGNYTTGGGVAGGINNIYESGNCYYLEGCDSDVSVPSEIGETKTEEEMKSPDFCESLGGFFAYAENDYPVLKWELEQADSEKTVAGDINSDGTLSVSDLVLMEKYLLGRQEFSEEQWKRSDLNNDGSSDSLDFSLLRNLFIRQFNYDSTK